MQTELTWRFFLKLHFFHILWDFTGWWPSVNQNKVRPKSVRENVVWYYFETQFCHRGAVVRHAIKIIHTYIYRIRTTMTEPYARIFAFNFGSSIKLHVRLPTYIDDNYCTTGGKLGSKSGRHFHKWNQNIAWFIWNSEISVSIAIHCYERLF